MELDGHNNNLNKSPPFRLSDSKIVFFNGQRKNTTCKVNVFKSTTFFHLLFVVRCENVRNGARDFGDFCHNNTVCLRLNQILELLYNDKNIMPSLYHQIQRSFSFFQKGELFMIVGDSIHYLIYLTDFYI